MNTHYQAAVVALAGSLLVSTAFAAPVNKTALGGVAVKGTDVVAYFTDGKALPGTDAHTHAWNGATWRFASASHRDAFAAAPEKYAPQYGGFCAWAMSDGRKAPIDPGCWTIVGGKLYLNYSRDIQAKWSADKAALIAKADGHWTKIAAGK